MRTLNFEEVKAATLTVVHTRVPAARIAALLRKRFGALHLRELNPQDYRRYLKELEKLAEETAA